MIVTNEMCACSVFFYSCFSFSFAVWQIVVEEQQKKFALFAHIQSGHPSGAQDFQVRLPYNNIVHRACRCIIVVDVYRNFCGYLCFRSGASRVAMSESDSSSLNSVELDGLGMAGAVDSDTGLESMSSAETPSGKPCGMCCCDAPNNESRVEGLRQDITRLKCDKLELLRQNVVSIFFPSCL